MPKMVLCPVDFSDSSIGALRYAMGVARKEEAGLAVLYTYRLTQLQKGEEVLSFRKKMEEEARQKFMKLESSIKAIVDLAPDFMVQIGFVTDSILGYVRKHEVSLLVLDRGIYHLLNDHGEAPDEFLHSLNVPFVIVPEKATVA